MEKLGERQGRPPRGRSKAGGKELHSGGVRQE